MTRKFSPILRKLTAFLLAVVIITVSIPAIVLPASAETSNTILGSKTVDPSTIDSWKQLFPKDNTSQAGRVWTDKSVFEI